MVTHQTIILNVPFIIIIIRAFKMYDIDNSGDIDFMEMKRKIFIKKFLNI